MINHNGYGPGILPCNFSRYEVEAGRELARRSLRDYAEMFWPLIEGDRPWRGGWHIDCICEHLEAVSAGEIDRLLINIPPRHCKSSLCSVFWPTWDWIENAVEDWLNLSYDAKLTTRDCVRSRRIIESGMYQDLLARDDDGNPVWELSSDQNQKTRYDNTMTGSRIASSLQGLTTGEGGDKVMVDDAHNIKKVNPESLKSVREWWTESMPTRRNEGGSFVVIGQRCADGDISDVILKGDDEYVHICMAGRYEGMNRIFTPLKWEDPRTFKGETLWMPEESQVAVEKGLSSYAKAGQIQQRPSPREGNMFKNTDWQRIKTFDRCDIIKSVRYWDKAATQGAGCNTAGVLMHRMRDKTFLVEDVIIGKWSFGERERRIKSTGETDVELFGRKDYATWIEEEPGGAGKESAERTVANLAGIPVKKDRVSKSKETRAEDYSIQVENHTVFLLERSWTDDFIEEHGKFPNGKLKDQVDSAGGAFNALTQKRKRGGVW